MAAGLYELRQAYAPQERLLYNVWQRHIVCARYRLNLNTLVACGRTLVVKLRLTAESFSPVHKSRH